MIFCFGKIYILIFSIELFKTFNVSVSITSYKFLKISLTVIVKNGQVGESVREKRFPLNF